MYLVVIYAAQHRDSIFNTVLTKGICWPETHNLFFYTRGTPVFNEGVNKPKN